MRVCRVSVLSSLLVFAFEPVNPAQIPLQDNAAGAPSLASNSGGRKLHGRFLQVTDFHPDPFYKVGSDTSKDGACHRSKGPSGYYGAETSDCDSPISLVNATFDWIRDNIKDSIDFVVWTGDSARHDNDEKIPRNVNQVVELNEMMVQKFTEVFGKSQDEPDGDPTNDLIIPVVPTFGNNDILPHNIFEKGPNTWTKRYLDIWESLIPEAQKHQFDQGGWFSVEVIPNHLAVFSLNSLYFFDSNSAVDGCATRSEPGFRQLEWLRIQLQFLRDRNMKAILIGHVPPARTANKQSWDETCWQKYALWMHQYRDVIVGSLYGHMNTDHFLLQDAEDINHDVSHGYEIIEHKKRSLGYDEPIKAQVSGNYLIDLRDSWAKLPKPPAQKSRDAMDMFENIQNSSDEARPSWEIAALVEEYMKKDKNHKGKPHDREEYHQEIGGPFAERFSVSHVSPSVVPNYFPTIRIYEYNITGLDAEPQDFPHFEDVSQEVSSESDAGQEEDEVEDEIEAAGSDLSAERKKKKKKPKKHRFTVPKPPSKSAPPGPAYSPQTLSLLGFVQYFANLTSINNDFHNESVSELPTLSLGDDLEQQKWRHGKHHGKKPRHGDHGPHPKKFEYEVLYDTRNDKVYKLPDLTTKSYLRLAQRIAGFKAGKKDVEISDEIDEADDESDPFSEYVQGQDSGDATDKKKEEKKHKDDKKKHQKGNQPWYTFVRRAFVNTMDPHQVRNQFGG